MVANDLLIARLVQGSVSDGLLQVAERVLVGGGFKFAKTAQRHCRNGSGYELEEMAEGIDGAGVLIGAVLQQAQVPPALIPVGFELLGLGVELDGKRKILLVAGGSGTGGEVVELRWRLRRGGCFLRDTHLTRDWKRGNSRTRSKRPLAAARGKREIATFCLECRAKSVM